MKGQMGMNALASAAIGLFVFFMIFMFTIEMTENRVSNIDHSELTSDASTQINTSIDKMRDAQEDMSDIPGIYVMILVITLIAGVLVLFR